MIRYVNRFVTVVVVVGMMWTGCAFAQKRVAFVDWSWESARVHNRIAGFIAEHGFGYDVDYLFADTVPGVQGMLRGDLDVSMESWIDNNPELWNTVIEDGTIIDLGYNFKDSPQGWYVPTYLIEGDPERGIEPAAPNLRTVPDLADYWHLFADRENPRKGRFYNSPTGWSSSTRNPVKLATYGLDEFFESFRPGSQAALDTSIIRAYEQGVGWVGYYWEPTWIMGTYDMTLLEEAKYTPECWNEQTGDFGCAFPSGDVKITVSPKFAERAPEMIEFLTNYETELIHTNEALAFMKLEDAEAEDAALWFLQEYESVWTSWIDHDIVAKVRAAL